MPSVYDVLDQWKLLGESQSISTLRPADWRQIDAALRQLYDSDFSGRLGSSFLGTHLTTRIADGAVGPEALAMPALVFDSVWLFDPVYSLISVAASDVWNLLPERNMQFFGKGPHIWRDWRPLGHQKKYDRHEFLLKELPRRLQRLRELRPLHDAGAIRFVSWEALLLKHKDGLKSSIDVLRAPSSKMQMHYPQSEYNIGVRLDPIRIQVKDGLNLTPGTDLHIGDRTPMLLYGLVNTLVSTRCGAVLHPELPGDADVYEFVMSGLNSTPKKAPIAEQIELPQFSRAVWDDILTIRKDSEALATVRELIQLAANSNEAAVIGDVRTRLEGAAEKLREENGLLPFFRKGSTKLGFDAVKGSASRVAGTMATGAVTGAISGGPAGAVVGAAAGGIAGAGLDFLWNLATRSFDKDFKAKAERAELFVRIAERLPASNRD
ncbi:hypothetical protein [Bradyrhizobium sp. 1200_D9_N1_1]|uniref:hypothetical protein n=1 Tax=Bradyrhizobium sp. 1200_D9_N1_1 TaxID=3239013 RepID=UPI003F8934F7